jgi:hypothetical protein
MFARSYNLLSVLLILWMIPGAIRAGGAQAQNALKTIDNPQNGTITPGPAARRVEATRAALTSTVTAPAFSPASGRYTPAQTITISSAMSGAAMSDAAKAS